MVDLCAAGESRTAAAKLVAPTLADGPGWETLRLHYRRLESAGNLPEAATPIQRKAEALEEAYRQVVSGTEEARKELAVVEESAKALGLDLSEGDLFHLARDLQDRHQELKKFLRETPHEQRAHFVRLGIDDPEEAKRKLFEYDAELALLQQKIDALERVRDRRSRIW